MQLTNEFDVSIPIEETWRLLTDLERVGPCLPGASVTGRDGDDYLGQAKIKVGPITAQYKGTARFIELDESQHRAVLSGKGREARGGGDAQVLVTATLVDKGDLTHVTVLTELTLSGKLAQFGRGVMNDVSTALLKQFVVRVEAMLQQQPATDTVSPAETGPSVEPAEATVTHTVNAVQPTVLREAKPVGKQADVPPVEDDDDALSVLTLARSIIATKLQRPVPFVSVPTAALLGALIVFLLRRRRS